MLNLDYRDARPIYEQVKDGLRRLMVTGVIREGEKLPSVRAMAGNLAINPNTIQRAYEALEAEGRRSALLHSFDQTASELLFLGMTAEELWERIRALRGGETDD